jgi:hypothetical protein
MRLGLICILLAALLPTTALAVDAGTATKAAPAKAAAEAPVTKAPAEPTEPKEVPDDASAAIDAGKQMVEDAKAKKWFAFSAGGIWILMFLFKAGRKNINAMKKIPKRALWIAVPLLSVAAMVLAKLQSDLSWGAAVQVLFSGPSVAFLNDLLKRGIAGKTPSPMGGVS